MTTLNQKTSLLVPQQLPEFIRDNPSYGNFVEFIRAYYEWMEQEGKVIHESKNLLNYADIDKTSEKFMEYYVYDFLQHFPEECLIDKKTAVKFARELYKKKGTPAAYQFLFRVLYNSDFDVFYTKDALLKPSDGLWYVTKSLKLSSTDENFLNTNNLRLYGETTKSIASIENSVFAENKIEIFISNIQRLFKSGEYVTVVDNNNQPVLFSGKKLRAKIVGQISQILINPKFRGLEYQSGDPVIVYGGLNSANGFGAVAQVDKTTTGSVQKVSVLDGGFGFSTDTTINFGNLNDDAATPIALVGSLNPTLMPPVIIRSGGIGYLNNDDVYANNNLIGTVTSVNANGSIQKITYNPSITVDDVIGETLVIQSKNVNANGAVIVVSNVEGNGTANVSYISNNTIALARFTQISDSSYNFLHGNPSANKNTTLKNALDFMSFSTYPLGSVVVVNGGGGISKIPTVDAVATYYAELQTPEDLSVLGILAPIQILDGGLGYSTGNTITISGGSGVGATANIASVDEYGTITSITYTSTGNYPPGGLGYRNDALPTVTINRTHPTSNAILQIPCILGTNDLLSAEVNRAGSITTIKIKEYGEDYVATPNVSIRVMDILVNNLLANNIPQKLDIVYQGDSIDVSGFSSIVDSLELFQPNEIPEESIYRLRVFNYTQNPDLNQQLKAERQGASEENDIYFNVVDMSVPINYFYNGSPKFINGVKVYGDGTAKANATFLNGLTISEGQYLNSQGHLDSYSVLQSDKFNNFTYQITVEKEIAKYRTALLKLLHPTGMRLIGRNSLRSNTKFNASGQESTVQGHTLYYYTGYAASTAEMYADFTNTSNNIIKFNNLGAGVNIGSFIFANSIIQISTENGPNVKSEIVSINYNANTIVVSSNTWLTYNNVAYGTANSGQNTISVKAVTPAYNLINNGVFTDKTHPLKDIVYADDQVKIGSQTRTVNYVDYENGLIYMTSNFSSSVSNSLFHVKRTFVAGGTLLQKDQVIIYGPVGQQYIPELTTVDGQFLTTEDDKLIILG